MSRFEELCGASETASAEAQAHKERERAELEQELQDARALAHQLVAGMAAYFQCPDGAIRYVDLGTGEADLHDLPTISRDGQGFWGVGVEMGLTGCRVRIGLTLKKGPGHFRVRLGGVGYSWPFPGSDPRCLYEEIFLEIKRGLTAGIQHHRLEIGISQSNPCHGDSSLVD
jgi:hypothetical protein